ncbi:unnamed protein product, partial [Amoebophrya sp. A25]|eukprot:GSA25T00017443001.1
MSGRLLEVLNVEEQKLFEEVLRDLQRRQQCPAQSSASVLSHCAACGLVNRRRVDASPYCDAVAPSTRTNRRRTLDFVVMANKHLPSTTS